MKVLPRVAKLETNNNLKSSSQNIVTRDAIACKKKNKPKRLDSRATREDDYKPESEV